MFESDWGGLRTLTFKVAGEPCFDDPLLLGLVPPLVFHGLAEGARKMFSFEKMDSWEPPMWGALPR